MGPVALLGHEIPPAHGREASPRVTFPNDYCKAAHLGQPRRPRDETLAVAGRISSAIEEHERIFDAISSGHADRAARAASDHVEAVRRSMDLK